MGHVVHHQDASGTTHLDEVASLYAALERVEELRNRDGASAVRVFREVPVEVRTYYKAVAVDDAPAPTSPAWSGSAEVPSGAMPLVPPVAVREDVVEEAAADEPASTESHRRPLFSRG
jgi:hypothetical protein